MTAVIDAYGLRSHAAVVAMVRKEYAIVGGNQFGNAHRLRREAIAQRLRLYRDDGRADFERLIDLVFDDAEVRKQRRTMIDVASEQNVTRRIVDEVASLYDQAAVRKLADVAATDELREVVLALEVDEVMQQAQRLLFLCNEILLWRTRTGTSDRLNVVTPDTFDAVPDPADRLTPIAFLIDCAPSVVAEGVDRARLPHWELWDDTYRYLISGTGELVDAAGNPTSEPIEHGLGRIPGVLFHKSKPVDRLLDSRPGSDIVSAHLGVGLLNVMIMRLSKSQGERQPVLQGPLAQMAAGQKFDGETPIALPPDVFASMLDSRTDPSHYIEAKREKISAVAQSYGMSYEQFTYAGAAESGKAYAVRRQKLTELRNEQRRRALVNERLLVVLLGFSPDGMRVDFQEQTIPLDAAEELSLLRELMKLGLDSPVKYYMRKNPDASRADAIAAIRENLTEYAIVILAVRSLNAPLGGDADNAGQSPQQNGAKGGRPANDERPEGDETDEGEGGPPGEADNDSAAAAA